MKPITIRRLGQNRRMNAQCSTHVYEVRPRKDHRRVDLISDVLPFGRLWYGEPNAISNVAFIAPQVLATKVCGVQPLILAVQSAILGKLTQGQ
jgi:hypothetical protein